MSLHIGTMGWSYNHLVGNFCPSNIKAQEFLFESSEHFNSVEINSTFYRTPSASTVKQWRCQTPSDFIFSAKLPRSTTHAKMLQDCNDKLSFFLPTIAILNDKLGLLLIQLPPQFKPDRFSTDVFGYSSKFYSGYPSGDAKKLLFFLSDF